jgi:diguanylate cyclase (GGDEF)-like protein
VTIAQRIKQQVRGEDFVARLGGDEFIVVMSNIDDVQDVFAVGLRLLDALQLPMVIKDRPVSVGASIGMTIDHPGWTAFQVLQQADEAMYEAKQSGKNQLRAAPPLAQLACSEPAS